ncbi:MAG TPA: hemerythrin domain-containing protein [Candidatus Binatia bacterium]|jgi:hemerythrin-like domain-containing protein
MRHSSLVPLSHDHHHGLALALRCRRQALGQLQPAGAEGLRERAREFREFFAENLVNHFRAEEEVLFPELSARIPESRDLIDLLVREHEQMRSAIPNLQEEIGLAKIVFDLGDLLERHIRKEERELFPLFEENADLFDVETVGERITNILRVC